MVTGGRHLSLVESALSRMGIDGALILVEPRGRNTGPAVAAAALAVDPGDVLVILPSDHVIGDQDAFRNALAAAVEQARAGFIVTFGIPPTRPDIGYGYIEVGEEHRGGARKVARFKEKPDADEAVRLVSDGRHLWNSGMFVAQAGSVIAEMARLHPTLLETVRGSVPEGSGVLTLRDEFSGAEALSFDHAVMEHTDLALVFPLDAGWDDVGSYLAIHTHSAQDADGNASAGRVVLDGVTDSLVVANSRLVAVAGLTGVAVIETPDAVLVVPLDQSQRVRKLAEGADKA